MRHKLAHRKLGRKSAHRTAMLANLTVALITHGSIVTTVPKCKELRKVVERLITMARKNKLAGRRRALAIIRDETAVAKLFSEVAPAFAANERGGYTRITTIGRRHGDAAEMAKIELLLQ